LPDSHFSQILQGVPKSRVQRITGLVHRTRSPWWTPHPLTGSGLWSGTGRGSGLRASEVIPPGSKLVNPIPDAAPGILRPKTRVFRRTNPPVRKVQQYCPAPSHTVQSFACSLLMLHSSVW